MGEIQIWQKDGCGTDESTIRRVIGEFRENGVQGINSQQCLSNYIQKLSKEEIFAMYDIDEEVTLQILVDSLGVKEAFKRYCTVTTMLAPNMDRLAAVEAELDNWQQEASARQQRIEELTEKVRSQNYEIVTLKAKLYDTYEAMHNTTENSEVEGDHNKCRAKTEKTPSELWA